MSKRKYDLSGIRDRALDTALAVVLITISSIGLLLIAQASLPTVTEMVGENSDLEGFSGLLSVSLGAISVLIAYLLFTQSERTKKLNRRAEVIISCIQRYDDISNFEAKSGEIDEAKAKHYFGKFFALKSDQVDFYLAGWVDADTFIGWMWGTLVAYRGSRKYHGYSVREGWRMVSRFHSQANKNFYQLMEGMEHIAAGSDDVAESDIRDSNIQAAFEEMILQFDAGVSPIRRLLQRDFRAREYFREISRLRDFMKPVEIRDIAAGIRN